MPSIIKDTLDLWSLKVALRHLTEDIDTVRAAIYRVSTRLVVAKRKVPSLLNLPRELRDEILCQLLVSSTEVRPYSGVSVPLYPSILGACKQLHDEGIGYLYKRNTFLLDEPINAMQFFTREFQGSRSLISDITLNL